MTTDVTASDLGVMSDGTKISVFTLCDGVYTAHVMTYGARIASLEAPDRSGNVADLVLGYDSLAPYLTDRTYFGAVAGRYANRIAHGSFFLNGIRYSLSKNADDTTLHGGLIGFDKRVWAAEQIPNGVEMTLVSENGDQGFPGRLTARVRYTLAKNTLQLEYFATTDADTVLNLTNHSYFNLAGEGSGDILDHVLTVPADRFTPTDAAQIPTGEIISVADTPFDFRKPTRIGERISSDDEQLRFALGYDQNFVLTKASEDNALREAARVLHPASGRVLTVETTQLAVQFYSGNHLNDVSGKHGHIYAKRAGFCLETQHFPNSPNQPEFPSTELKPGQTFRSVTRFAFSTD